MVLACVAMLLFPVYWEGRHHAAPGSGLETAGPALSGRSTLTPEDLQPRWRGPRKRGDEDS